MSWSYSGNPGSSSKDEVRFLIGDTEPSEPVLQDEEITYVVKRYNGFAFNAAIECCEAVVAKFSRLCDEAVGQVKVTYSQRVDHYQSTLIQLRNRLAMGDCAPFCGGISEAQKQSNEANTDRVKPDFTKQMMDNHQNSGGPGTEGPGNGGFGEP